MTDYIERGAAISELRDAVERNRHDKFGGCLIHWTGVKAMLECIPAAEVRPVVRGEWIGYPECLKYPNAYSDDHIVCSACEECFSILDNDCERFNYCPNCGADMREDEG